MPTVVSMSLYTFLISIAKNRLFILSIYNTSCCGISFKEDGITYMYNISCLLVGLFSSSSPSSEFMIMCVSVFTPYMCAVC